jgi:hypothetical protein
MNPEEKDPIPLEVICHPAGSELPSAGRESQEQKAPDFGAQPRRWWERGLSCLENSACCCSEKRRRPSFTVVNVLLGMATLAVFIAIAVYIAPIMKEEIESFSQYIYNPSSEEESTTLHPDLEIEMDLRNLLEDVYPD